MPVSEAGEPALTFWGQIAAGLVVGLAWAGTWIYNLMKGRRDAEPPRHVVLEQADLADMNPIRQAVSKLDRLFDIERDLVQLQKDNGRILEILERIDREDLIRREVQARLRDEQRHWRE